MEEPHIPQPTAGTFRQVASRDDASRESSSLVDRQYFYESRDEWDIRVLRIKLDALTAIARLVKALGWVLGITLPLVVLYGIILVPSQSWFLSVPTVVDW